MFSDHVKFRFVSLLPIMGHQQIDYFLLFQQETMLPPASTQTKDFLAICQYFPKITDSFSCHGTKKVCLLRDYIHTLSYCRERRKAAFAFQRPTILRNTFHNLYSKMLQASYQLCIQSKTFLLPTQISAPNGIFHFIDTPKDWL